MGGLNQLLNYIKARGFRPIGEKFLQENHRLALQFEEGWVFLRILAVDNKVNYKPFYYTLSRMSASSGTIEPAVLFKTANNEKITDITQDYAREYIYHVGIGVAPATEDLRIYVEYPHNTQHGNLFVMATKSVGDDYGYITSLDSPYDLPTDALEFIVPFGYDIAMAFANKDETRQIKPTLNFVMRKYQIKVLDPNDTLDAIIIGKIARGTATARLYTIGSPERKASYTKVERYWMVKPISMDEAKTLGL